MYDTLFQHIRKFATLDDAAAQAMLPYLQFRKVKKKEFLLREGDTCNAYHFVLSGCLRMYFINENGAEQITHFGIENWWLSDYMSLETRKPSRFNIQAVENSEIALIGYEQNIELSKQVPQIDRYFRHIMQRAFAAAQQNLTFIYGLSGEERYHHFADTYPGFVQRIPQYMVASYLGFTPEFVSKIKAKRLKQGRIS